MTPHCPALCGSTHFLGIWDGGHWDMECRTCRCRWRATADNNDVIADSVEAPPMDLGASVSHLAWGWVDVRHDPDRLEPLPLSGPDGPPGRRLMARKRGHDRDLRASRR